MLPRLLMIRLPAAAALAASLAPAFAQVPAPADASGEAAAARALETALLAAAPCADAAETRAWMEMELAAAEIPEPELSGALAGLATRADACAEVRAAAAALLAGAADLPAAPEPERELADLGGGGDLAGVSATPAPIVPGPPPVNRLRRW
jgi:hypothetical protein